MSDDKTVRVAVRIRPLVLSELEKGCVDILEAFTPIKQVRFKNAQDKAFTFNYIFDQNSDQNELYENSVKEMIENLYNGYNVTILAYGQTGSGKTYTMGTGYQNGDSNVGVIPRSINDIFNKIEMLNDYESSISVAFIELYQENLYDLLSEKSKEQTILDIREDPNKGIMIPGLTQIPVTSPNDVFNILSRGSAGRATGATNMNATSSRSHAIFTIILNLTHKTDCNNSKTAKLHLVDLAGSERSKKTGAVGTTFKEGININKGLLVLGNVISALGDRKQQNNFIPYRDSNLTRLLKDSLGGNSITLMIACVSPADYNYDETLSTLRYADRARKIQNKPVINQDPQSTQIQQLKRLVEELKLQILAQGGPIVSPIEIDNLKKQNLEIKSKNRELTIQLSSAFNDNMNLLERIVILQNANEELFKKLKELRENYNSIFDEFCRNIDCNNFEQCNEALSKFKQLQKQFNDINNEQKKIELELKDHEEKASMNSSEDHGLSTSTNEINEEHELHTNNQIELNARLQELSKQLAIKQRLADYILTNNQYAIDYNGMNENEQKIRQLEKEKDELLQQLRQQQNPLNEQRRKRVQELEQQIQELMRKVRQQSQLIKLKEKDEQKIQQLNKEILQMKQTKVKLIRSMREENERFKRWKQQRERELMKLKQQDRKKQNEIVKMQVMHQKQQNVLKRKVEEAAAVNKRLKDALQLRQQRNNSNKNIKSEEKLTAWLKEEFDLYVNLIAAKTTLTGLLDDRATLQKELNQLLSIGDADENVVKTIQDDLQLRSVQIQDLQQKISDSDEDARIKTRFDNIQTMSEAKLALKTLFDMVGDLKKNDLLSENKLIEVQENQNELLREKVELEKMIKIIDCKHAEDVAKLQKEYEERVSILLEQVRGDYGGTSDVQIKKRCTILEENNQQLEKKVQDLMEQIYEYQQQNDNLQGQLDELNEHVENEKSDNNANFTTPINKEMRRKPKIKVIKHDETFSIHDDSFKNDSDIEDVIDNHDKDPDWRNTPIGKFLIAERKKSNRQDPIIRKGTKRASEGGCTCTISNCTKRCGCKRMNQSCTDSCKCSSTSCSNRRNLDDNYLENTAPNLDLTKKPRSSKEERDMVAQKLF